MNFDIVSDKPLGQGGLETVITAISKELTSRGNSVRVVLTSPSIHKDWESKLGEVNYLTDVLPDFDEDEQYRTFLESKLYQFYRNRSSADIIIVARTGYKSLNYETVIKQVVSPQCIVFTWPHLNLNLDISFAPKYDDADGLLAIGQTIQQQSLRKFPSLPAFFIGNPINLDVPRLPRDTSTPTFLFIGRIAEQKRLHWIIRAFSKLKDKKWRLVIVGGGEKEESIKQLASQLKIYSRIDWHPFQPEPWSCVPEASALILPSSFEGFPMVLLEALSRGVPAIATDCPTGPSDIITHGENGYLVGVEDFDSFVDTLTDVINGDLPLPDSAICESSVQMYSSEIVVDRLFDAIDSLSKARSTTSIIG